jgi:hypothetical protein
MITFWNSKWPSDLIRKISGLKHTVLSHIKGPVKYKNLILGIGGKGLAIVDANGIMLGDAQGGSDFVYLFTKRVRMRLGVPPRRFGG